MYCKWCGNRNDPDAKVCAFCEKDLLSEQSTEEAIRRLQTMDLPAPEILCPRCGAHHTALAEFCSLCGASFRMSPEPSEREAASGQPTVLEPTPWKQLDDESEGESELEDKFDGMVGGLATYEDSPRAQLLKVWLTLLLVGALGFCACGGSSMVGFFRTVNDYDYGGRGTNSTAQPAYTPPVEAPAPQASVLLPVPPGASVVSDGPGYVEYKTTSTLQQVASYYSTSPAVLTLTQQGWDVNRGGATVNGYSLSLSKTAPDAPTMDIIGITVQSQDPSLGDSGCIVHIEYHVSGANVVGPGL